MMPWINQSFGHCPDVEEYVQFAQAVIRKNVMRNSFAGIIVDIMNNMFVGDYLIAT